MAIPENVDTAALRRVESYIADAAADEIERLRQTVIDQHHYWVAVGNDRNREIERLRRLEAEIAGRLASLQERVERLEAIAIVDDHHHIVYRCGCRAVGTSKDMPSLICPQHGEPVR